MSETKHDDLNTPDNLTTRGKLAHEIICRVLRKFGATYTGGCTTFYSPTAWRERGEQYGLKSHLIVVYDGGDVRDGFDPYTVDCTLYDAIVEALREHGLYFESCTGWYSAVYDG